MKIISWNINGLNAKERITNLDYLVETENPDIICLSETKLQECKNTKKYLDTFNKYFNYSTIKKGYSGVAIFSKSKPLNIINDPQGHEGYGRTIMAEYKNFYLVSVYVPNSGNKLVNLDYRINSWEKDMRNYLKTLNDKPLILTGDLNCAHTELDIYNPKRFKKIAGFTIEERTEFGKLMTELKLFDSFRELYPNDVKYSFFTYRGKNRANNLGWRLDYFLLSESIRDKLIDSNIIEKYLHSDHQPIVLSIKE